MAHELMTDDEFCEAIEQLGEAGDHDLGELIKAMNESRIISWEEAERILQDTCDGPVKSSLPEQTRPSEPENDTDVEQCIRRLNDNDPTLKEVNLNNMKRTPVPQIRRLLEALAYNEFCERISLANMGLYDNDIAVLPSVLEINQSLKKLNLETNYLSGDFFSRLFKAACINMSVEEIKAVNQGVSFATTAEKEIIDAIVSNKGLTKVSVNLRLPEGRHKIEKATLRNGEIKRVLRREAALKAKQEAEELAKNPVPKLAPELPKKVAEPPKTAPPAKPRGSHLTNPTIASTAKEKKSESERRPSTTKVQAAPLVRRQSNADQSSTPVIAMVKAVDKTPPLQKGPPAKLKKEHSSTDSVSSTGKKVAKPMEEKKSSTPSVGAAPTSKPATTKSTTKDSVTKPPTSTVKKSTKPKLSDTKETPGKATPESEMSADSGTATPVKKSSTTQPSTIIKDTLKKLAETNDVKPKAIDATKSDEEIVKKKKIVKRVVKKKKPVDGAGTDPAPTLESKK